MFRHFLGSSQDDLDIVWVKFWLDLDIELDRILLVQMSESYATSRYHRANVKMLGNLGVPKRVFGEPVVPGSPGTPGGNAPASLCNIKQMWAKKRRNYSC